MTSWDVEYLKLCRRILTEGVEVENRTGINTIKVPSHHFHFDLEKEFPILQTKQLFFRQAILEMFWIYQVQSNNVDWLQERNVHIWDLWRIDDDGIYRTYKTDETGSKIITSEKYFGEEFKHTIGTAYGWIVDKYHLIDNLIETIQNNSNDRRMVLSLWQNEFLKTAVLPSCVWSSEWDVTDGKLNAWVHQRSCDVPAGLPFNVTQYATLLTLLAKVSNLQPGTLDWSIKDAHIYVNQISGIEEQLRREKKFSNLKQCSINTLLCLKEALEKGTYISDLSSDTILRMIDIILNPEKPYLWVNPDINDFYKFDNSKELKDVKVKNYKHMGKINFPVAQ